MAEGQDKPSGPAAADEFATLAPSSPPKQGQGDTKKEDIFATLGREIPAASIPAGQSMASLPATPTVAPLPFDKIGDYDVIDKIGHGGMGLVLKAKQRKLKRVVALKLIKLGQMADEQEVARFMIEARAAAHLKHPNIVGVYEIGEHAGSPFFSMEYVEGQSLHKLISERPLDARRAAIILKKLALAVDYAHESGILHRDLKPHNILLDKYEEPKITDFGLAASAEENSQLTATGTVLGTPSYMPPEQARGKSEEMGKWSDVYSLGATLYEMIVGRPPFAAATLGETLQQVMTVDPVSPRSLNPAIPRDIETIALKCLEKAPARRYQTAHDLADELQRFLEDRPILARPTSRSEKFVRWCRRNPVIAGSIAAVFSALVFAVIALWIGINRATAAKEEADATAEDAMEMVDKLLMRIGEDTLLNQPGMQEVRADIETNALASYEKLLTKLEKNKRLPEQIALVRYKMGRIKEDLDSPEEALSLYESAHSSLKSLLNGDPDNPVLLKHLSAVQSEMGHLHYVQNRVEKAKVPWEQAVANRQQLLKLQPQSIEATSLLASAEMNLGLLQEALGQSAEAFKQFQSAQQRQLEVLGKEPDNLGLQRDQAKGLSNLGAFQARQRKFTDAEKSFQKVQAAFETLSKREDRQLEDVHALAISLCALGEVALVRNEKGDLDKAAQQYDLALKVLEDLVGANPAVHSYWQTRVGAQLNLAVIKERQEKSAEAFEILKSARDVAQSERTLNVAFGRYYTKSLYEMLRLRRWMKLTDPQQQTVISYLQTAADDYGQPWVASLEKQAQSAPEFPKPLTLEESELLSVGRGSKN